MGRAGTGKTEQVQADIRRRIGAGETELLLIVPEQYSHYAERKLCGACGDALSLHGETLSFTRLCERVFVELGHPAQFVDGGGQMLVMHRAIESVAPELQMFGAKNIRAELLESVLEAVKEFKSFRVSAKALESAALQASSALAVKLNDLALILDAYDALLNVYGGDTSDMLTKLAELIEDSRLGDTGHIYFDGFNDFTAQELRIIEELLKKNADITVCLTCDLHDDNEIFELPRRTAGQLRILAEKYGAGGQGSGSSVLTAARQRSFSRPPALTFLEKHLFSHELEKYSKQCDSITIYSAPTKYAECEYAADKIWELVRLGYRWKDIGVMARDWEQYGSICENVFEKYGVPYFSSGRADILDKPPVAHIDAALEIAAFGWEHKPVFRYLKTGLMGISANDCAELENYVLKWGIRGAMWLRDWTLPTPGYHGSADAAALERLNRLRRKITQPVMQLSDGIKGASDAGRKLCALYEFLEDIGLPNHLAEKAGELEERGESRIADEYTQLWDVIVGAVDQMYGIIGEMPLSAAQFRKILLLVLSRYDVGVIPISIDRTAIGSMAMSRRRDLKCLIVLGATDDSMPMLSKGGGALSESEREELGRLGVGMPAGLNERLCREMNMLYSALTLPSQELVVIYSTGGGLRPSSVVKRIQMMFGIKAGGRLHCLPAVQTQQPSPKLLSASSAKSLYGQELVLSPSRVDKYYSCPYQHFLMSGLRLKPRIPAEFDAPMAGEFMHFVLEGVSREIKETVGYKKAGEELCRSLAARHIEKYVQEKLFGFEGKNARFAYLFRRLGEDVVRILSDMLDELRNSDFEPMNFELDISELIRDAKGDGTFRTPLRGIIDRIDGWERNGKLYLRVIDYKTGKKEFSLSDIMYGRDMQMLIYLFALQEYGKARYGNDISPAGVLYVPARDVILKAPRGSTDEEIKKSRMKELRRSGIVLHDPIVLDAMETTEQKQYLPIKQSKDGALSGDSLVNHGQVKLLSRHIGQMLENAASEILEGKIEPVPYYKNENDNACLYCEFRAVCAFDEESGGKRRFAVKMKTAEIWEKLGQDSD